VCVWSGYILYLQLVQFNFCISVLLACVCFIFRYQTWRTQRKFVEMMAGNWKKVIASAVQGGIFIVPHLLWHGTSVFFGLIRRTAPFSRLLRHTRGCGGSILTRILTGSTRSPVIYSRQRIGRLHDTATIRLYCYWLPLRFCCWRKTCNIWQRDGHFASYSGLFSLYYTNTIITNHYEYHYRLYHYRLLNF
jgi:hypothetical protein